MDRRPPISDAEQPAKKIARAAADRSAPTIVRAELEAMQTALSEGIDLEDIKFRPVGGGKNAAYVPAEAAVCVCGSVARRRCARGRLTPHQPSYCAAPSRTTFLTLTAGLAR